MSIPEVGVSRELVRGHGPQHLNGTFGPGVPAEQISRFRKTVNLCFFWIFGIFLIFGIFGRVGFFDDFLTGPRSAKNFRSRMFDDREMAEKSIFPVGDHFPRPYDANFLRPGNGRKIDFSSWGPLFGVLTMLIC